MILLTLNYFYEVLFQILYFRGMCFMSIFISCKIRYADLFYKWKYQGSAF